MFFGDNSLQMPMIKSIILFATLSVVLIGYSQSDSQLKKHLTMANGLHVSIYYSSGHIHHKINPG